MLSELLIFVLIVLVVYLYYGYWKKVSSFTAKGLKVVPGVPLFGNFLKSTFLRRHIIEDINECYNAFSEERYVGIIERTTPVILIRDPDIIKQVTVRDFDHFVDRGAFLGQDADPIFANNLSSLKGEKWQRMRTTLNPAFTGAKIRQMFSIMDAVSLNVIDYLKKKINGHEENTSEEIYVDDLMRRYANDVIASAAFALEVNSLEDKRNEFYEIGQSFSNFSTWRRLNVLLLSIFPKLAKKLNIKVFSDETTDFFRNIIRNTIQQRKQNDIVRPDMIQLLMDAEKGWSEDELIAQPFVFFLAGFETSSAVLVMAIHELALNSEAQSKLHEEVKSAHNVDESLDFDTLKDMQYLDMVVTETLRKWSPALFLSRICTKPYQLPPPRPEAEPYMVEQGQLIFNAVSSIHMDEKYYPDPDRFDPERFAEENKKKIKPFTFMPFGVGPRNCIGSRFALLELKVLLCRLVLNFEILKCHKTTEPLRLQPTDFQIKAFGGTWVKLRRRNY